MAASMAAPSRCTARSVFSPARRAATEISRSSSTKGVRKRFWYSRNPLFTQSGRRVPAAINRHFMKSGARGGALGDRHVPQLLEPVKLAHARQHDMHDHVMQVDQHPIAVLLSFDA